MVLGDRSCIESVIAHLLSNAIKFSPDGRTIEVHVSASPCEVVPITSPSTPNIVSNSDLKAAGSCVSAVTVAVRDCGPGITLARQTGLFDSFSPVRPDRLLKGQGSGNAVDLTFPTVLL